MKTVLVVDDDPTIRSICRQMLENADFAVAEATNGQEAIEQYRAAKADVILMDIIMPEKDGIDAILELRSLFPHVKIVAMSGGGAVPAGKYLSITQSLGVHGMLKKPFHAEDLVKAIRSIT